MRLHGLGHLALLWSHHRLADSKKNVLVLRFFLLFSLLDVPYISKGVAAEIPIPAWATQKSSKFFLTFPRFDVP